MPELPEVETVKSVLEKRYINKTFSHVEVRYPSILDNIGKEKFEKVLVGQTIQSFSRRGKYIIIHLSDGTLISHLRMEGKYKFDASLIDKHSHILFYFTDGSILIYHDVRKFGRMYYFNSAISIEDEAPLNKLGKEPLEEVDEKYLYQKFHARHDCLKKALLDQSILAGIGNIYADEICFASGISPLRKCHKITHQQCNSIINNAKSILKEAIQDGGSTIKTFQSAHGVDGLFQVKLNVYGKEGTPCPRCHSIIVKKFVDGRGTHYCKVCQK